MTMERERKDIGVEELLREVQHMTHALPHPFLSLRSSRFSRLSFPCLPMPAIPSANHGHGRKEQLIGRDMRAISLSHCFARELTSPSFSLPCLSLSSPYLLSIEISSWRKEEEMKDKGKEDEGRGRKALFLWSGLSS